MQLGYSYPLKALFVPRVSSCQQCCGQLPSPAAWHPHLSPFHGDKRQGGQLKMSAWKEMKMSPVRAVSIIQSRLSAFPGAERTESPERSCCLCIHCWAFDSTASCKITEECTLVSPNSLPAWPCYDDFIWGKSQPSPFCPEFLRSCSLFKVYISTLSHLGVLQL